VTNDRGRERQRESGAWGLWQRKGSAGRSAAASSAPPHAQSTLARALPGDSLGYASSSLGDAGSSLGDAKSSLGDAKSSLGDAESSLGDAESSLGDAESSLGDAESSLGDR
jgi:hypothetical protein